MGIPSFYGWLTDSYPDIVVGVVEESPRIVNGVKLPIDTSRPNPNLIEFDNLYLDMNGIIHPCFHPSDVLSTPKTYEEVFENVFIYIDKIFSIVRPRKLIFLGIDGVAPRAKMNQQRSRRFRAAKDAAKEALKMKKLMELGGEGEGEGEGEEEEGEEEGEGEGKGEGEKSTSLEEPSKLDSNVITPGTEFMDLLSSALRYYIRLRMNNDSGWREIKVILSDSNVPGEGEHKIMSYIRLQRNLPGYDPNTRHCLYGLDADLIMLALATHEVHFTILREEISNGRLVMKKKGRKKNGKNKRYKNQLKTKGNANSRKQENRKPASNLEELIPRMKFVFLNIWVLREKLENDLRIPDSTFQTDLERLIDDFIFMCLFVGNDFLPHIPTLRISKGAIDLLMMVYRKEFLQMGGYLTNSFEIDLTRVEHFIQAVGSHEDAIFYKHIQKLWKKNAFTEERSSKRKLRKLHSRKSGLLSNGSSLTMETAGEVEFEGSIHHPSDGKDTAIDKGEGNWKESYYVKKFKAKTKEEQESIRRDVVFKYVEGICWVMRYYYEGVCSWQWFYPYHYAPFASDFYGLDQLKIQFILGEPFKPLDQLMGVLPAASAHALPISYRKLMTDASSPILDFYPSDFKFDMNGRRKKWQAICLLPFIEESRLLSEIAKVEHTLTDDERRRNSLGLSILFVHISHPLADMIIHFSKQNCDPNMLQKIDPELSGGMNGFVRISDKAVCPEEVFSPIDGKPMIAHNRVIFVSYTYPLFHHHISRLPEGLLLPDKGISTHLSPKAVVSKSVSSGRKMNFRKSTGIRVNKVTIGGRCEGQKRREGEHIPRNLKQGISHDQRDGNSHVVGAVIEIQTQIKSAKRKRGEEGETIGVPDKNVVQSEQYISHNQRDGNSNVGAVKERKTKIKAAEQKRKKEREVLKKLEIKAPKKTARRKRCKERKRLKKREEREGVGVLDKNVVQSELCIIHDQGDGNSNAGAVKEIKTETKGTGILDKNVVHLEPCTLTNHRQHEDNDTENMGSSTTIERLDGCVISDKKEAVDAQAPGIVEVKTQVKSKKRKRRSDKRKQNEIDECHASMEQRGSAARFVVSKAAIPSNNEKLESSGRMEQIDSSVEKWNSLRSAEILSLGKSENDVCEKQGEGCVINMGRIELKKQARNRAKRKKQKMKKRKARNNGLEKLESGGLSKQAAHDDNSVDANGPRLQSQGKAEKEVGGVPNSLEEVKSNAVEKQVGDDGGLGAATEKTTEVKSGKKKKKQKPRKKRRIDADSLPKNVVSVDEEKMVAESTGASALMVNGSA